MIKLEIKKKYLYKKIFTFISKYIIYLECKMKHILLLHSKNLINCLLIHFGLTYNMVIAAFANLIQQIYLYLGFIPININN